MGVQDLWVLIIVLGLCFQSRLLNSQNLSCHPNDLRALEDFLRGLESVIDGWGSNSSSNCCTWPGINCNSSFSRGLNDSRSSNRVVKLELGKKSAQNPQSLPQLPPRRASCVPLPFAKFRGPGLEL